MSNTSPFSQVHKQLGARFEEYHGWSLPADFGNIDQEQQALNESCAVVDLSAFERFVLKGTYDRKSLNDLFVVKSDKLFPDRWVWVKVEDNGRASVFRAALVNGGCMLLCQPGESDFIGRYVSEKTNGLIETENISLKTGMLGIYGPNSLDSVRGLLPFDISDLEPGGTSKVSVFMMSFTLLRGSWLGGEGLELICPAATGPMAAAAIAKYRQKRNIIPAGMNSLDNAISQATWPV